MFPTPEQIISASGIQYKLLVYDGGFIAVSGANVGGGGAATGSESFIYGKSGTSWIGIRTDENGVLDVNATVTTGSVVYQGTDPWIVLGSQYVSNTVSVSGQNVGSIGTQTVVGSVAVTAAPLTEVFTSGNFNVINTGSVAITNSPTVKPNGLLFLHGSSFNVDASAVHILDSSAHATMTAATICNCGSKEIYLYNTSAAGPFVQYKTLAQNESWEFPLIAEASASGNDVWAERVDAQTNDNVVVIKWTEG